MAARLFVDAVGMFTPVGHSVETSAGMIYTGMTKLVALSSLGRDGEAIVGVSTPFDPSGPRRLLQLASFALHDCAKGARPVPTPVVLCLPREEDLSIDVPRLLSSLSDQAAVPIDLSRSRAFRGEAAALGPALEAARVILERREAEACYVGGVDSLVDPLRLATLTLGDRVKETGNPDGFIPGEAAAFLRLTLRPEKTSLAVVAGVGLGGEAFPLRSGRQSGCTGLTDAIRNCLAQAGLQGNQIGVLAHSGSGERYFARELAITVTRLPMAPEVRMMAPALSLGETGAALGPVAAAYLAFLIAKRAPGLAAGGAMFLGSSVGAERTAVALTAA